MPSAIIRLAPEPGETLLIPDKILATLVRVSAALHGVPGALERLWQAFHHGSHTTGTPRSEDSNGLKNKRVVFQTWI